ncbi:MAG: ASCH domain-containing protein [Planctomycetota bacterium]|nr:MAG: ASCH domain-containing protein [Planctomycetota bacterium]
MRQLEFRKTVQRLLEGRKTATRRDWKASHARRIQVGELIAAYSKPKRAGGEHVATIRVQRPLYQQRLDRVTPEDLAAEGGLWADREAWLATWRELGYAPDFQPWVLEFEVVEITEAGRTCLEALHQKHTLAAEGGAKEGDV